jgi:nicotinamide-nucleotide amidase
MKVEVISIGAELLMSDVLDTNAAYISRSLQTIGAELIYKVTVGDNLERITDALRVALARADVVMTIGGLGTAVNDFTRAAAAVVTGHDYDAEANVVVGATPIDVVVGTSTPFYIDTPECLLFCLPGNRREMAYILETAVYPYLQRQQQIKSGWVLLRTVGLMESSMRQRLGDLELAPNQTISYDSYAGQTNIRLQVDADTEDEIETQIAALNQKIRYRLGDHIYGEGNDRLETVLIKMLRQSAYRLVVAECHTNRFLSRALEQSPNHTAVVDTLPLDTPAEVAEYLKIPLLIENHDFTRWCRHTAEQLRVTHGTNLSLLLFSNQAQGGVQLSAFLSSVQGVSVTQRSFGGHPENINQWACTLGLSHLHRWLLAHATG